MAQGRMLKKRISSSKKFANLKSDKSRTLYLMILAHLDVEGRFEADPLLIKGQVIPLLKWSSAVVSKCLEDMRDVGLIALYNINGEQYLQYERFADFQTLRKDRESESEIPPPVESLEYARPTPPQVKLSKDNISQVQEKSKHLDFVFLTPEEYKKLIATYGENNTCKLMADLNRYIGQSGKKYKSHYFTLLNFAERDDIPKLVVPKEDAAAEQRGLERKRQEIQEMYGDYLRERTIEELQELRKDKKEITRWWLIDKIIKVKDK